MIYLAALLLMLCGCEPRPVEQTAPFTAVVSVNQTSGVTAGSFMSINQSNGMTSGTLVVIDGVYYRCKGSIFVNLNTIYCNDRKIEGTKQ